MKDCVMTYPFLSPRPPSQRGERNALFVMMAVSGIALLLIGIYYVLNPRSVIGDSLVNSSNGSPAEIPPPSVFPIYVKPITIFFVALIVFSYCSLSLIQRPVLVKLPKWILSVLLIGSMVLLATCVYEILFNFTLWAALLQGGNVNPDHAVNMYPVSSYKVNLVYATKAFVALLFVSYFAVCTLRNSLDFSNT